MLLRAWCQGLLILTVSFGTKDNFSTSASRLVSKLILIASSSLCKRFKYRSFWPRSSVWIIAELVIYFDAKDKWALF